MSDEQASNLADSLGNSRVAMLSWIAGTSRSEHETPEDVLIYDHEETNTGCWIATRYYHALIEFREDALDTKPVLTHIYDRVWCLSVYPTPIGEDSMKIDEIAVEAIEQLALVVYRDSRHRQNGGPTTAPA